MDQEDDDGPGSFRSPCLEEVVLKVLGGVGGVAADLRAVVRRCC